MQEIKHIRFPKNVTVKEYNEWAARAKQFQSKDYRFLFYIPDHLLDNRYLSRAIKNTSISYAPSALTEPNLVEIEMLEKALEASRRILGEEGEAEVTEIFKERPPKEEVAPVQQVLDLEQPAVVEEVPSEEEPVEDKPEPTTSSRSRRGRGSRAKAVVHEEQEDSEVEPTNDGDTPDSAEEE